MWWPNHENHNENRTGPKDVAAVRSMLGDVATAYPSAVGRKTFARVFNDNIVQRELTALATRDDAALFLWKGALWSS